VGTAAACLHIHCGDSSAETLRRSGVDGDVLAWSELPTDGPFPVFASSAERQRYVFDKILNVLNTGFNFGAKDDARAFFQRLRQHAIDWNYTPWKSAEFTAGEQQFEQAVAIAIATANGKQP